jgi:hypothetical protein
MCAPPEIQREHHPDEMLVLDIGGDIGALVLYTDAEWIGEEVDLTPSGAPRSHHVHTVSRCRRAGAADIAVGVYPDLPAGDYTVWAFDGQPAGDVTITGGRVSELSLLTVHA